jgi:hypothetical protein
VAELLTDLLSQHIAANINNRFKYGIFDCSIFALDWLRLNGIIVETGCHNSRTTAQFIKKHGSYKAAIHAVIDDAKLTETYAIKRGDIGMIDLWQDGQGKGRLVVAISTGSMWVAPAKDRGLQFFIKAPVKAWSMPCRK